MAKPPKSASADETLGARGSDPAHDGDPSTSRVLPLRGIIAWDRRTLRRIAGWSRPWADPPMHAFTWLGNSLTWWLHTILVYWIAGLVPAALLGGGSGAAALVAQAFKRSIRRRRPSVTLVGFQARARNPDRYSFPSGHTCGAVGGAVAVAFASPPLAIAYGVLAVFIAISRMYLGAHYPLDVLGGAAIGAVSGWVSAEVILWSWPTLTGWSSGLGLG